MAELTPEWLAEKRRIAEAATRGPWTSPWDQDKENPEDYGFYGANGEKVVGLFWYDGYHLECSEENARHIATFDPPAVLAMIGEIERLRSENDRLISDIKMITAPVEVGGGADAYLRYEVDRLRRERDTLDSGLDGLEQAIHYQDWPAVVAFFRAARRLLDGEKGGGGA